MMPRLSSNAAPRRDLSRHRPLARGLEAIGIFKLGKGTLLVLVGAGAAKLIHVDVYDAALRWLVPLEIFKLSKHVTLVKGGVLAINIAVVGYRINMLRRQSSYRLQPSGSPSYTDPIL